MADESTFGGDGTFGGGLSFSGAAQVFGGGEPEPASAEVTPRATAPATGFGESLRSILPGPSYRQPDPNMSALDQSADLLEQRVKRANEVAANPMLQFFNPEGVQKAREFVPKAAEELTKIRQQQSAIRAGKQQAETLGLAPGEVPNEATMAERVEVAKGRALQGNLRVFKGLQAVDPKAAEAIQDQVQEVAARHLTDAQYAFDKLSFAQNQGQYDAALRQLRSEGKLAHLEALGLKVPGGFDAFQSSKSKEGMALREARIGIDAIRTKLEERNTYQPMETKEADTYKGRFTTVYGDQISNGTWSRNAAAGSRGLVVNGAADPRDLGKTFTLATPEQRKSVSEEAERAVPKEEMHKYREFDRTYEMATHDGKGNPVPEGRINTNPNVQQGIAEGLASMLRGGSGGANQGLLKIELDKRGWSQQMIDGLVSNYAGFMNTLFSDANRTDRPYLSQASQKQIREVMDVLKKHNDDLMEDRIAPIAKRAGALGLDTTAFGWGKDEAAGVVGNAIRAGREEQIARMMPMHQAIGGGDGVFQLGAQRPGVGAVANPPGTAPATQLPGQPPVATPVQQASGINPAGPNPAGAGVPPPANLPGGAAPPAATAPNPTGGPGPAGGGSAPVVPVRVAGVDVGVALPPGASPNYVQAMQRIETPRAKDPWTATTGNGPDGKPLSSASGAFQFIDRTWRENKPEGAPDRAKDATPEQQAQALATFTAKNAAALQRAGLPVNDTSLYVAHNLGAAGGAALMQADPNADARSIVGEDAAKNNPKFFKGRPTVAKVLERYAAEMNAGAEPPDEGPKPKPGSGGATASKDEPPGLLKRISRMLMQGVPEEKRDQAAADVGKAAVENAPAIGSTMGAIGGAAAGGVGAVAGGAAGAAAGQSFKDWMQGRDQSPSAIAKEAALGAVLGVGTAARPIASAAARAGGVGAVEAGAKAAEGGGAEDIAEAGGKGVALGAGGELFGRALGMAGHKVWNLFAPDAKKAVQTAATKLADAEETLAKELPKIPGVNGAAAAPNPKFEAAQTAKAEAEQVLKDAGLDPAGAAYAAKAAAEGVPKAEAQAARPGKTEEKRVGEGYQQLEREVADKGVGAPKAVAKLPDGPRSLVESKAVSAKHAELAEQIEMKITAPAPDWATKWQQLKEARSDLLTLERDAYASTATGKTREAEDMRKLADAVREQQAKVAKYLFGEKDGPEFMKRLKVLDTRYRNLMEATNGGDLVAAAAKKGEAGREAEKKFMAFAYDDPQAQAAYKAMRAARGNVYEASVPWTVAGEGIPGVGKVIKVAKLATMLREWARERAAGAPVRFQDLVAMDAGNAATGQAVRDTLGTAGARGATM